MADRPVDKTSLPSLVPQNPAPFAVDSQGRKTVVRSQVDRIMEVFFKVLPSNYASQVMGPNYSLQFQAAAEQIASFQISAQEVWADSVYDYTRSEVLYQILGALVFPDAGIGMWPTLEGDLTYRQFLQRMVVLLLQGATAGTVKEGVELLTTATVEVLERGVLARQTPGSAWGPGDEFTFEVNVTGSRTVVVGGEEVVLDDFPADPFTLQDNVDIVMRALKAAHTLYDYRNLFRDSFGTLFSDAVSVDYDIYYYEDFRKFCLGAERVTGEAGVTPTDRTLFIDTNRDFTSVQHGATLTILTGPNSTVASATDEGWMGHYRVQEVRYFPVGDDATLRAYTTASGLSGSAVVEGSTLTDPNQNWGLAPEGDILTFSEGPNAGSYRLKTVLGAEGGPVGFVSPGTATRVRIAPSTLRTQSRMPLAATGQQYTVSVDRLGIQVPRQESDEDASEFFFR